MAKGSGPVLDVRGLNRATLARQWLLDRRPAPVDAALTHLVGLQAQEPLEPYAGLWSRTAGFTPDLLATALQDRTVVRTLLMRRTIHLVTAADCLDLRGLFAPMLVARMLATLRRSLGDVDVTALARVGAPHFGDAPRTLGEVGRLVGDRFPGVEPRVLGDALSTLVPLVQVPPRGIWGQRGAARNLTVRAWLGSDPADPAPAADALVLRYLAAYGPAATADLRSWSGLTGLPAVVDRLRPRLRTFRDERGRELLDLPDAPLPDPDTPAPVRFLPAFDNAVLGYDDRSRIIDAEHRGLSVTGARFVLVDGRVAATWTTDREPGSAMTVAPLRPFTGTERAEVVEEAERLQDFLSDGAGGPVTVR